jgi:RNA polymerase sigma-70 factor, ECF subfamily
MSDRDLVAEGFEANRRHLQAVAYRILGSRSEAEDAVQEAWLRLARSEAGEVDNLRAWLTTVVARLCLDMLRTRKMRAEQSLAAEAERQVSPVDAERDAQLADSVDLALLVVLDTLAPAERVAFVLHDLFNLPFEEIAPIVNRSPAASRQLASRARRRVQGSSSPDPDQTRQREIVSAFMAASRDGDFNALLAVLDPAVVLRADAVAVQTSQQRQAQGAPRLAPEVRGATAVAAVFRGRARAAKPALVDGAPGLVFAPGGKPFAVFDFVVENGRITEISLIADPATIQGMQLAIDG